MAIESDDAASATAELRHHAERRPQKTLRGQFPPTSAESLRLIHELEAHQIELEMQNAELRQVREQLEKALDRCASINASLEERIGQAVSELRRKDQELLLKSRQAVMGEMINNIAHQWRQPLNALALILQEVQLRYRAEEFSGDFFAGSVDRSMRLIRYMSRTIDDFRDFFRIDKASVPFGVDLVIERTLSLVKESFQEQGVEIIVQKSDNPIAEGYPGEFSQALLNILLNARDALLENGVSRVPIVIRSFSEAGKAVVTITDEGGGIAEGILGTIFDPYVTTKKADQGTGIGLFMAKGIVEHSMRGRLTARNTGSGAEFRIEI